MLRTIILRNQILNEGLKKAIRSNITRCMSTELSRRKLSNKVLISGNRRILSTPQWTGQLRCYANLPSHIKVNLPALSPTMESGSIVSWVKKEGDQLSEGDLLCEIETDKATMGFETPEEGYLAKIMVPAGTKGVQVGKLVCIIVENKDDIAAFKDFKDEGVEAKQLAPKKPMIQKKMKKLTQESTAAEAPAAAAPEPPAAAPAAPAPAAPAAPVAPAAVAAPTPAAPSADGRVLASPFAKRIAEIRNVRLEGSGSGLFGSLKSADVNAAPTGMPAVLEAPKAVPPTPQPGASFVDIPLTNMREIIAKRLTIAKQTVPHYQLSVTVNVEKTMALRKAVNDRLAAEKQDVKLSMNDFIVKAVASASKRVPQVNSHWMDSYIRQFANVDVSVAVATPTGLITPILFNSDSRGIIDLSKNMKELVIRAKQGKLQPNEYQGGTVSVSNLGMYGIKMFNAIINPPQSLILAAGGLQELVIPDSDTEKGFRVAKFVTFTASADHRVIDGAVGAQWMTAFKQNIEDPANMIL